MVTDSSEFDYCPVIYPDDPVKCVLLTPPTGLGVPVVPCSRSYVDTLRSFALCDWYSLLFTSEPFREACERCPCHRCINRNFLIWNGKDIRLFRFYGFGRVVAVECFYRHMAIIKVFFVLTWLEDPILTDCFEGCGSDGLQSEQYHTCLGTSMLHGSESF